MKGFLVKWEQLKLVKNLPSKGHIVMIWAKVAMLMPDMGHINMFGPSVGQFVFEAMLGMSVDRELVTVDVRLWATKGKKVENMVGQYKGCTTFLPSPDVAHAAQLEQLVLAAVGSCG